MYDLTDRQEVLPESFIISLAETISTKLGELKLDISGYKNQKLAVNLIKLGEKYFKPDLVHRGESILQNLPINLQFLAATELGKYYRQELSKIQISDDWLTIAIDILRDCVHHQQVTSTDAGIIPENLVRTILED